MWINLLIRLVLAGIVVHTEHWLAGDSRFYLDEAARVCSGYWGGHASRTPGYEWLLCAFTPKGAMFVQTLLVWCAGLWLSRRTSAKIALFWFFDPGLLIYSAIVMTDALFAAGILAIALSLERFLTSEKYFEPRRSHLQAAALGVAFAFTILIRVVGIPLALYSFLFLIFAACKKRLAWRELAIAFFVAAALLAPRLYWDVTQFHQWSLATQGPGWFDSVAGYVQYYGTGLDPYQSEIRYIQEHPSRTWFFSYQVVLEHFPTWCWLTAKSIARILIGHLNTEWGNFFIGEPPIGPAWFKYSAQTGPVRITGWLLVPWVAGLLATALYCCYVYARVLLSLRRARRLDPFCYWAIGAIVVLVFLPQVWGDARFRTSIWPLVLLLWGWGERNRTTST